MNRRYDTSEGDGPLGSDSDDLQLNSRMAAMNLEYDSSWSSFDCEIPLSSGPDNTQRNSRISTLNHRYNTPWWASVGDGPLGFGPDNPQLNSRMTLQMLERLCENGPLYAVEVRYGGRKYGKVEVKGGRILIHSFQTEEPVSPTESKYISFPELLSRFNNGSSELPKTVFLRVTPDDESEDSFDVIILTERLTPRAKNFILHCSALKGPSYKGLTMLYTMGCSCFDTNYAHPSGGFSLYHIYSASPLNVVEGIRDDDPETPWKEGGVYGMREGEFLFEIQLKDYPYYSDTKFGVVVAGLQEMKDLGEKCSIEECGLVI